jgi:hypothetical protein
MGEKGIFDMKIIAENELCILCDEGENWVFKSKDEKNLKENIFPKKKHPNLPLSAMLKYEMTLVDKDYIREQ